MRNDQHGDDPRKLWLNQPTETQQMTLQALHQKSRDLQRRTRKKLLGSIVGPLGVLLFYAYSMKEFAPLRQTLQPMFVAALAWSLLGLYFLNRGMWSAIMPADEGFSTGLAFCRGELQRQRDLVNRVLLWSFGPLLLAIGAFILALVMIGTAERSIFPNGLPFLLLVVAWVVGYFMTRLREQRKLVLEMNELNEMEKANGSS